jgi:hypothetical protein
METDEFDGRMRNWSDAPTNNPNNIATIFIALSNELWADIDPYP